MTELIVALDCDDRKAYHLYFMLKDYVKTFKLRVPMLMQRRGWELAVEIAADSALFLDLKLYDTRDSVQVTLDEAVKLGAAFITVHESCIPHIQNKHINLKVISVDRLTDGTGRYTPSMTEADGFVCDVETGYLIRGHDTSKIIVCPGIRLPGEQSDNHRYASTPQQAKEAGIDYIVVGRPIVNSDNPVEVTKQILQMLKEND